MDDRTAEQRLLAYMVGWRKGALGSAVVPSRMKDKDFKAGHDAGQAAANSAYGEACTRFGAVLNPLR